VGRALADADHCQPVCESLGDHVNWANAQMLRFWIHHYQGQAAEARATAQALLARAERTGNLQQKAWSLRGLALCDLAAGTVEAATAHLEPRSMPCRAAPISTRWSPPGPPWPWPAGGRATGPRALTLAHRALDTTVERGRPTGHSTLEGCSAIVEVLFARARGSPERRRHPGERPLPGDDEASRPRLPGQPRAVPVLAGPARLAAGAPRKALRDWTAGNRGRRGAGDGARCGEVAGADRVS
jgi:hypothetical protein